jgi:hypothetical protein
MGWKGVEVRLLSPTLEAGGAGFRGPHKIEDFMGWKGVEVRLLSPTLRLSPYGRRWRASAGEGGPLLNPRVWICQLSGDRGEPRAGSERVDQRGLVDLEARLGSNHHSGGRRAAPR